MEYLIPPWDHQLAAIERAKGQTSYALFFEMGTGKTSTTVNILRHKINEKKRFLRTLIFAPPIVLQNWKREWLMHSKVAAFQVVVLHGSQVQRIKQFLNATENSPKIVVTNYESLLMTNLFRELTAGHPDALVFDESHKLKNPASKRTKAAITLADTVECKYILTGTPILNTPMDIFAQFRVMDGGASFGKNFFGFRATYFYDKNAGMPRDKYFPNWQIRPGSLEAINAKIFASGMRVTKEECLDLPPLVKQVFEVGMLPEQERMYAAMKKDLIAYVNEKACVAQLALTKALRLMQIASGFAKLDDGSEIRFLNNPKKEALKELLSELTPHHKVIVWAVFKENYEQIREVCKELKINWVEVHGEVTNADKFKAVDSFKDDPSIRVFLGHPGSGGIGTNLTVSSYTIFFSRNFSLENDLQAEARNHRGGSREAGHTKITRIDLVSRGTIEEFVLNKLANKEEMGESLLNDIVAGNLGE